MKFNYQLTGGKTLHPVKIKETIYNTSFQGSLFVRISN